MHKVMPNVAIENANPRDNKVVFPEVSESQASHWYSFLEPLSKGMPTQGHVLLPDQVTS
jgi:hypothetical protein